MILRTVGMLYRYVAVLHRRFPLHPATHHHRRSPPSSYIIEIPPRPALSRRHRPLSQSGAQRLRFTVASRSFARSRGIRITRVRYHYPIVRPHACDRPRAHTRASLENGKHRGQGGRNRGITPLVQVSFFFFFFWFRLILII